MLNFRKIVTYFAFATLTPMLGAQPMVSDWPSRAVKIVVGFPAGQGSDVLARIYASELQKTFGQPFIVDNRPGAGATLAAREVARSEPNGYSILFTSSGPLTVAPHFYSNLGFDPMKDLEPIAVVGRSPLILLVRPDSPYKTLPDLVATAKKRELNFGSGGNGVTNHLALEIFKATTDTKLIHIPYKGAAPALTDLMGGQIDAMFEASSAALVHVKSGRLRALAVTSLTRYSELPEIPTVAEYYAGFDATPWAAFALPRGTPRPIIDKLSVQLTKLQDLPAIRERMTQVGVEAVLGSNPAKAKAYTVAEYAKWGNIIQRANLKIE